MTGQQGRSGGRRDGAGRPPTNIAIGRKFTIRAGQQVIVRSVFPDGLTQGRLATVALGGNSRNRIIELSCDDGELIVISLHT
jgi:hypothetical protein